MSPQGNGRNPWEDKYGKQSEPQDMTHTPDDPKYGLAALSLGLGIGSIVLCMTTGIGIILGGVAILLGFLSRGKNKKLLPAGKRGVVFGIVGVVAAYIVMATTLYNYVSNPDTREAVNSMYEQYYGVSFDEALSQLQQEVGP